jgi:hypothetical protein
MWYNVNRGTKEQANGGLSDVVVMTPRQAGALCV